MPNSEQPPQRSLEERLYKVVFNAVFAGTGVYALYTLIVVNDLLKAAIAALISFGFGLVSSFGQGLTTALNDKMRQRGESSGQLLDNALERKVDQAVTHLTQFHQQYLEALKTRCYSLNVEGYKGRLPRLVLDKIYVPLKVNSGTTYTSQNSRNLDIWKLLPKATSPDNKFPERLIAIIANPGYGKTTLMRFLALSFSNGAYKDKQAREFLPVLLLLRDFYAEVRSPTEPSLPDLIVNQVKQLPRCKDLYTAGSWFEKQLKEGKCLVMLDGLDEVPDSQRDLVSRWANWQMQHHNTTQFILTSRPHGYDPSLFDEIQRFDILDFNSEQKQTFIEQWYRFVTWEFQWKGHYDDSQSNLDPQKRLSREQAEAESDREAQIFADDLKRQLFAERSLTELAKNPLLITIIAATHKAGEQLPKRRVDLYQEIFKVLLEHRPYRRETRLTITNSEDNQKVLQVLALSLTKAEKTQFSAEQGSAWIQSRLAEVHPAGTLTPKGFLDEIQKISGLLAGGEGNLYEFTHKTFQEYLAALELSNMVAVGYQRVRSQIDNEEWKEVVYFFAMLKDPVPFIEAALENPNVTSLTLAQRLVQDHEKVKEDLKDKVLDALQKHNFAFSAVHLQQHFRDLVQINNKVGISGFITWGEYNLFQQDQLDGQFHSQAAIYSTYNLPSGNPIEDISWEDARWFCAWLSTQASLASEDEVYEYRLPTPEEWQQVRQRVSAANSPDNTLTPRTTDPTLGGNALCVVRECIPDRYKNLVNYLANGAWKEADQETDRQMLKTVGSDAEKRRYLELEEIREFPCDDLRIIDRLWVKFSGGRFGFSVQKKIWVEVGGKLDHGKDVEAAQKAFALMSDRNGWRQSRSYIPYSDVTFDASVPEGHLPLGNFGIMVVGGIFGCLRGWGMVILLSHPDL